MAFWLSKTAILAAGMLISGSINTIASKYQDSISFDVYDYPEFRRPNVTYNSTNDLIAFNHPLFQTFTMFIGETLCLFAFGAMYLYKKKFAKKHHHHKGGDLFDNETDNGDDTETKVIRFNPVIFALPALCDTTATTMMYIGLLLTYASVYQMIRGAVVVFTAIFSVLFLKRKLRAYHWTGVGVIVLGTILVGLYSVLTPACGSSGSDSASDSGSGQSCSDSTAQNPLVGDILVIAAQVVAATQMVVEEKFIGKYKVPPLLVVGFEGCWGLLYTTTLLIILHFAPITFDNVQYDSAIEAFKMMGASGALMAWVIVGIFSIAFFNFFGISVTSTLSASHRMILDTCRTLIIVAFSLLTNIWMGSGSWQPLQLFLQRIYLILQFSGFAILVLGALIYFEVIKIPRMNYAKEPEESHSINDEDGDKRLLLGDHRDRDN